MTKKKPHCVQLDATLSISVPFQQTLMVGMGAGATAWEEEEEEKDEGCCRRDPDEELLGASGGYSSVLSKRLVMVVSTQFVRTAPRTQSSRIKREQRISEEHRLASDTSKIIRQEKLISVSPHCSLTVTDLQEDCKDKQELLSKHKEALRWQQTQSMVTTNTSSWQGSQRLD